MSTRKLIMLMLAAMLSVATVAVAADDATPAKVPQAVFETTIQTFDPVVEGVFVTREFKIKNSGSADLKINTIKTG